ncbi:DUF3857 domain-containing protein [Acidithiobacillus sp. VAN18-1]|uniref:DUF3857 domain-containing protein n=2 Tax=Igneacidithiobacillus copahuensis TaxID=2724909 RepID=A0AAE2YN33_9PROT|nr:DUF3857 domain-containing protein [Igneacidithiobacillus copahuensis]MBU2797747.1 DUF3857 domain-containing protein [Acidithiobacillus sp. VAN18-2]
MTVPSACFADSLGSGFAPVNSAESGAMTRQLSYHAIVKVKKNGTYTDRVAQCIELLNLHGESKIEPFTEQYSATLSSLKVKKAWIETRDGKQIPIPLANIFVRPVPVSHGAPMYSHAKILSILPPKMSVGDTLHIITEKTVFKPYFTDMYSSYWNIPESKSTRNNSVEVVAPAEMHLQYAQRGAWKTSHSIYGAEEIIRAEMQVHHAEYPGLSTVGERQYSPIFEVTSFPNWAAVGTAYWKRANQMAAVTPLVSKVADEVAADKSGWAAQKALFSWDSANIRYVGLELGVGGFVPIAANKTLETGYGDCKAHSTLLQALFNAKNFQLYPAIINWDNVYNLPPLPTPFWFNHAIDYAPRKHLFLDSTGEYETPGQLAVGERDKPTVVTGPHPRIVMTPGAEPSKNQFVYAASLVLQKNGTLTGTAQMRTMGWWAWAYREIFASIPPSHYATVMSALLAPSGGGFGSFQPGDPAVLDKPFHVLAKWTTPDFTKVGSYLTFPAPTGPFLVPSLAEIPNPIAYLAQVAGPLRRKHPVETYLGGVSWTTTIQIPAGYRAVYLPVDEHLRNAAGSYFYSATFHDHELRLHYRLELNKVVYNPKKYQALRDLLVADLADQESPLVFRRA